MAWEKNGGSFYVLLFFIAINVAVNLLLLYTVEIILHSFAFGQERNYWIPSVLLAIAIF